MTEFGESKDDTYEMFWDCKFCRTRKLLGLSHRHCPVCGAPQNASERYFPDDAEKVRVADHVYIGRDLVCRHCGTFNSRNSRHCRDCGAPTNESSEAQLVADLPPAPDVSPRAQALRQVQPRGRKGRTAWLVWLAVSVIVAGIAAFFLWKREASFEVTGHLWERRIEIERFGPVRDSAWCDQLPAAARELRRYRAVRSHEQIPDGETCTTRRVDQGDGTFREVKDCKPRYKSRPIEDNRCDYEVNRWSPTRHVESSGRALSPAPTWPAVGQLRSCALVGCERQGPKRESYKVHLRGVNGEDGDCELEQSRWSQMKVGARYKAQVRVLGGGLDCSSLTPL
jgi:hypothetical protein